MAEKEFLVRIGANGKEIKVLAPDISDSKKIRKSILQFCTKDKSVYEVLDNLEKLSTVRILTEKGLGIGGNKIIGFQIESND